MASSRRSPAEAAGHLAAGLRVRRSPIGLTRSLRGVGDVGRSAIRFSALTFLSQSARRRELQRDAGVSGMLVRPPDYWSGGNAWADEAPAIRTGDAAYDALLARRVREQRAARPAPPPPRGLPSTIHRRGRSLAGPMTGPSAVVRRLQPAPVPVVPNAATTSGKPNLAATPAPQAAPRRPRARPPAGQPQRTAAGSDRPGGGELRQRSTTRDAIRTPSFDALLDSVSSPPASASVPSAPGSIDTAAIARVFSAPAADDDAPAARVARRPDRAARPLPIAAVSVHASSYAVASQPVRAGGVRRLSFARASALAGRSPWEDVQRMPVGTGTAAVPVATAPTGSAASETVRRMGTVARPPSARAVHVPSRASRSPAVPAARSSARTVPVVAARATVTTASPGTVLRRHRVGGGVSWASSTADAPANRVTLPRAVRTATSGGGAPVRRGGAETPADALRRVFGDPTAATAGVAAAPTPASATRPVAPPPAVPITRTPDATSARLRPSAPPSGDRVAPRRPAPRTDPRRPIAPVIPLTARPSSTDVGRAVAGSTGVGASPAATRDERTIARHWATIPGATPDRDASVATGDVGARAGVSAVPGSLFAASTVTGPHSGSTGTLHRSAARPGTVLTSSTTHAPLALAAHVAVERRLARLETSRLDAYRLPVGAPMIVPSDPRSTSTRAARATVERRATARAARQAGERTAARVTVRRLPLGATSSPLVASRTAMLRAADERRTGGATAASDPTAPDLARRLAALESPFELVRRVPVGAPPAVLRAADATMAPTLARPGAEIVTASAPVRHQTGRQTRTLVPGVRTSAAIGSPTSVAATTAMHGTTTSHRHTIRSPRSMPARSLAPRRMLGGSLLLPTAAAASAAPSAPQLAGTTIAPRLAALTGASAFDLVRRVPVGAPPAVITTTRPSGDAATADERSTRRSQGRTTSEAAASRVRRALLLPNARVLPSAEQHAADVAAARIVGSQTATDRARRLDAVQSPGDAVRRLPVGAPAVVVTAQPSPATATARTEQLVRRSGALPTAPVSATAPGRVLPGRRSEGHGTMAGRVARRAERSTTASASSPASRLRDLVATGAFEAPAGSPARAQRAAAAGLPPAAPVLRTAAERFQHVLRSAPVADRPVALPERFRPLAERIVGPRVAVRVVHGAVTREALAAAGHDAATTERTIHLPVAPDASARTMSVVAHELEHVAAPSVVPRFHGGVDSPEERRAMRTEQVVRRLARKVDERGGSAASAGIAGLPVGGLTAFGRSGSGTPAAPPGPPVPASALSSGGGSSSSVQRSPARVISPAVPAASSADGTIHRALTDAPMTSTTPETVESTESSQTPALSPAQLSAIIRAVEDRLLEEIERRGGFSRGAF